MGIDERRSAPHVARNAAPIIDVLRGILPDEGLALEIASGSGEHVLSFARAFPHLVWQPSDPDEASLQSIRAWRGTDGSPNLLSPLQLDAAEHRWPIDEAQAILCINMVHISPWTATEGLMAGAGRLLGSGCPLFLYGAYRQQGVQTAPSNEAFDQSLIARNPMWGLRDLDDVVAEGSRHGLELERIVPMPANNLSVIFRRRQRL